MLNKGPNCRGCVLEQSGQGFMQPSGTGVNGVLLVGEALGEEEAIQGLPFVGKSGAALDKMLTRGGLNKDDFKIANTIWCRPPNNKISGMYWAEEAIAKCSPYLDGVIHSFKPKCIVALGVTAFKRLVPNVYSGIMEARGYVFWSSEYQTWVIPTLHPAFVIRGKTAFAQVIIHDIQRAVDIARDGHKEDVLDYLLDPTASEALKWVEEFEAYAKVHPDVYLSCDIETPGKDADEEGLDLEDGADYVLLRCGYSYRDYHALSIPWDGPYRQVHERLLGHSCSKVWWNGSFDIPRILSQGVLINGASHDGMDAWHVLNSDLKKSLGFVAPFFRHGIHMWKHMSRERPAYYNAIDADVAGSNMRGTVELLKKHGMWKVYEEFVIELDPVYSAMTRAGMPVDIAQRVQSSKDLINRRNAVRARIEQIIPNSIKTISPKNGFVRPPADVKGLSEFTINGILNRYCSVCGIKDPKKAHFKSKVVKLCSICRQKWTKAHTKYRKLDYVCAGAPSFEEQQNPCVLGTVIEKEEGEKRWARIEPFLPSTKGIIKYQQAKGHPLIMDGRGTDKKVTTNNKALKKLIGKYPTDEFYPLVEMDRDLTKIGGTYCGWWDSGLGKIVGGFPVGRDGRIHPHFRHTPSTLRSSCVAPNLQNVPRGDPKDPDAIQNLVKAMFVSAPGTTFLERDFSGIEAVLVGYHATDRNYIKLAKTDIHSYFTAYNLNRIGVLPNADLPQLSWSDADLKGSLAGIKKRFKTERDIGKRCIHAGNYRVGPGKLHEEYPEWFPKVKDAAQVLAFYYELFPLINKWHERICLQVDKTAVTRNSFGHAHRFYQVLAWEKRGQEWTWSYSDDAKRLIAFGPQSDAAFIGKRALKRMYYEYPESIAKWLRLFIHDSVLLEIPVEQLEWADREIGAIMEAPVPELPLPAEWQMGDHLTMGSESKRGVCWGQM